VGNFLQELKRRNVYKVAAVYAAASWLLLQVADTLFPAFDMPDSAIKVLAIFLLFGFPIALILSWAFELTSQGIQITVNTDSDSAYPLRGRDYALVFLAVSLIIVVGIQQIVIFRGGEGEQASNEAAEVVSDSEAPSNEAGQNNRIPDKSVAVLPFVAMSSGEDDGYFADGLTEELLNSLVQLSDLKVPGRTSSFYYKGRNEDLRDIGEALGVAHVLEGSVRRAGDQLRITAQLVNASDGFHLWSATFDRTLDDIFAIQDEIADEVTRVLRIELLGEEAEAIKDHGTDNPQAQQLYMIGLAQRRELGVLTENMQADPLPWGRVRAQYEQAVALDPDYAEAWAALADILLALSGPGLQDGGDILLGRSEGTELALAALERAEAIAPDAPATLLARAQYNERELGNSTPYRVQDPGSPTVESVLADYQRALGADADNLQTLRAFSGFLVNNERPKQAIELLDRIVELDPLSPEILTRAIYTGFYDPEEARRQLRLMADLYPDSNWRSVMAGLERAEGHLHHAYLYLNFENLTVGNQLFIPLSLGVDIPAEAIRSDFTPRGGSFARMGRFYQLMFSGDYEGVISLADSISADDPDGNFGAFKWEALIRLRRFEEAMQFLRDEVPGFSQTFLTESPGFTHQANGFALQLAYALQQNGETDVADVLRARVRENMAYYDAPEIAPILSVPRRVHELNFLLFASEGRIEEALDAFEGMVNEGWLWLYAPSGSLINGWTISNFYFRFEDYPLLDPMRDHPRFIALLDRVKSTLAAQKAELDAGLTIEEIQH